MNTISAKTIVVFVGLLICTHSDSKASEYLVEWSKNKTGRFPIITFNFQAMATPWHTVSDPIGINLINPDNLTIRCIRIKAIAKGVTFRLTSLTKDSVFPTVWLRKNDGGKDVTTEAVFMDGDIQPGDVVWNQVKDTSNATGDSGMIFEGQIYRENFVITDPANWIQLPPYRPTNFTGRPGQWEKLCRSLPKGYDGVSCYAEAKDGNLACFTSLGFPFAYNFTSGELRPIVLDKIIPSAINQIKISERSIELWSHDAKLAVIDRMAKKSFGSVLSK